MLQHRLGRARSLIGFALLGPLSSTVFAQTVVVPKITLQSSTTLDQDDMCFWLHPSDPSLSTVIVSDKASRHLYVYDLQGSLLQAISTPGKPGNIDVRYNFPLGTERIDIIGYNDRDRRRIVIHKIDPSTRKLIRVDDDGIDTGASYGFCLYRSPINGRYHAFTTSKSGRIEQYLLREKGEKITGTSSRTWSFSSKTEGCVCDDETAMAYFGEEQEGVWKLGAEAGDPTSATLIAAVGDASGLQGDVEGVTIYYAANGAGYLLVSNQGADDYRIYERRAPHTFVKSIQVRGVTETDGIDVTNVQLGPLFPFGAFAVHNNAPSTKPVELCAFEDLKLRIDTGYWDPRNPPTPNPVGIVTWGKVKSHYR